MAKHEFNRDLDDYVHRKKNAGKKSLFSFTIGGSKQDVPKKKESPAGPRDFTPDEVNMAMKNQLPKEKSMPDVEDEPSGPGFWAKIAGFFGGESSNKDEEDIPIEKVQAITPPAAVSVDVAEVLKITGKWLNRLDDENKQAFKESTDYAKYKFLLEKIKKQ